MALATRDYVEVQGPEQFKFEHVNQQLEGVLLGIERVNVNDKPTLQYVMRLDENRKLITFLATYDLQRKIRKEHIGHGLMVKYEGEDSSVQTQGNKLRRFKVFVSRQKELVNNLEITDEDIPF